jgi:Ca2+-binding RTX toxin-like protein
MLWATWTQSSGSSRRAVMVASSGDGGKSWSSFSLAQGLDSDDISSVVAFGGDEIGVMWSNQRSWEFSFAVHRDGEPAGAWSIESALSGPNLVDDHINLKAGGNGQVYAAVKTDSDRLILLLVREPAGTWSSHVFSRRSEKQSRPIVVIDEGARVVHMFASTEGGGTVYEKTAPLDDISFPSGPGRPVIKDADSSRVNNATSTKGNVTATTGLVVLASNPSTRRYWHHFDPLGGSTPPPTNTAPTASAASASTSVGTPVPITLRGADAEECQLTFAIAAQPAHGTLGSLGNTACTSGTPNRDTATVTYTPDPGYAGADSFAFTVGDGDLTSSPAIVTLTVESRSEPPEDKTGRCTIVGTPGDDVLVGTPGRDVICGFGGDDVLSGRGGGDVLLGGRGSDVLQGNSGKDTLSGGGGPDTLVGGAGADRLTGGRGTDVFRGGPGADLLVARDGRPELVSGGRGRDRARVDRGLDRLRSIAELL